MTTSKSFIPTATFFMCLEVTLTAVAIIARIEKTNAYVIISESWFWSFKAKDSSGVKPWVRAAVAEAEAILSWPVSGTWEIVLRHLAQQEARISL